MFMIQVHWMIAKMSNHRWSRRHPVAIAGRTQKSLVPHLWVHYSSWSWVCFSTFFLFSPYILCCDFFSNWELLFLRQQSTYTCFICALFPLFPSKATAQHLKTYRLETDTLKWLSATAEGSLGKRDGCLKPSYSDREQNSNNKPKVRKTSGGWTKRVILKI